MILKIIPLLLVAVLIPTAFAQVDELPVIATTTAEVGDLRIINIQAIFNENYNIVVTAEVINASLDREFEDVKIKLDFYHNSNPVATSTHTLTSILTPNNILFFTHQTGAHYNITKIEFSVVGFTEIGAQSTSEPIIETTSETTIITETVPEIDQTIPTASITLSDTSQGKMVNLIGDNFGTSKEAIITVTNPNGLVIQNLKQTTTSEGRINILFLLDETPIIGTYIIHLSNHSFEITLDVLYEGNNDVAITDSVIVGDPTQNLSPETVAEIKKSASTTTSSNTSTSSSNTSTSTETTLNSIEKAVILTVLQSVINLLEGLVLALG